MTDTRRAEFDKWCRDNRWTPTESMWAAWEACSMRYDAATAVQGGEEALPVAVVEDWPDDFTRIGIVPLVPLDSLKIGTRLYAAAPPVQVCGYCDGSGEIETDNNGPIVPCPVCKAPPAARQEEGREAARYRWLREQPQREWRSISSMVPEAIDAAIDAAIAKGAKGS